jgi:hypothetical protein
MGSGLFSGWHAVLLVTALQSPGAALPVTMASEGSMAAWFPGG